MFDTILELLKSLCFGDEEKAEGKKPDEAIPESPYAKGLTCSSCGGEDLTLVSYGKYHCGTCGSESFHSYQ